MGHHRAGGGDHGDFVVAEHDGVGERDIGTEGAEIGEQLHRAAAIAGDDIVDLGLVLGGVHVGAGAVAPAERHHLCELVGRERVGGVRHDPPVARPRREQLVGPCQADGERHAVGPVEADECRPGLQPEPGGLGLLPFGLGPEVHVERRGAAGAQRFGDRQPHAGAHGALVEDRCLQGQDAGEKRLQVAVVGHAAKEGHRQVGVGVHEPGQHDAAPTVDDRRRRMGGPYG